MKGLMLLVLVDFCLKLPYLQNSTVTFSAFAVYATYVLRKEIPSKLYAAQRIYANYVFEVKSRAVVEHIGVVVYRVSTVEKIFSFYPQVKHKIVKLNLFGNYGNFYFRISA